MEKSFADGVSPNMVLRQKTFITDGYSAYKGSLQSLSDQNVSVMPIECFSPILLAGKRTDTRVTIANTAKTLKYGFPALKNNADNTYGREFFSAILPSKWLKFVNEVNFLGESNGWGLSYRIFARMKELGIKNVHNDVEIAMLYVLCAIDETWERAPLQEKRDMCKDLIGKEALEETLRRKSILPILFSQIKVDYDLEKMYFNHVDNIKVPKINIGTLAKLDYLNLESSMLHESKMRSVVQKPKNLKTVVEYTVANAFTTSRIANRIPLNESSERTEDRFTRLKPKVTLKEIETTKSNINYHRNLLRSKNVSKTREL